jgi:hypothetical protein
VDTSIGKKVISTTTAALDGHSKPNHITAIGATATSGTVLVRRCQRQQAALQERHAVDGHGHGKAQAATQQPSPRTPP